MIIVKVTHLNIDIKNLEQYLQSKFHRDVSEIYIFQDENEIALKTNHRIPHYELTQVCNKFNIEIEYIEYR